MSGYDGNGGPFDHELPDAYEGSEKDELSENHVVQWSEKDKSMWRDEGDWAWQGFLVPAFDGGLKLELWMGSKMLSLDIRY